MIPLIRPCIWVNEDFLKKIFSELRTSAYQILVNARHHPKEPHQTEETLITAEVQLDNALVNSGDKASTILSSIVEISQPFSCLPPSPATAIAIPKSLSSTIFVPSKK